MSAAYLASQSNRTRGSWVSFIDVAGRWMSATPRNLEKPKFVPIHCGPPYPMPQRSTTKAALAR